MQFKYKVWLITNLQILAYLYWKEYTVNSKACLLKHLLTSSLFVYPYSTPEHRIIHLSCSLQRSWILFSNLGHGLLGGLALAHLLLVLTTNPLDWLTEATVQNGAQLAHAYASCFYCLAVVCLVSIFDR